MLHGSLTKTGIAIELTGSQSDFAAFYHTISELIYIAEDDPQAQAIDEYFLGFAYDFRKASEGLRDDEYGNPRLRLLLISFLALVKSLRYRAGRQTTDRALQSNLYWLEHIVAGAFYDATGRVRSAIEDWLSATIDFGPGISERPEFLNLLDYDLLEAGDTAADRLLRLPELLSELLLGGLSDSFKEYEYRLVQAGEVQDVASENLFFNFGFPPEEDW